MSLRNLFEKKEQYPMEKIQTAMIASKEFAKDEVMTGIITAINKVTSSTVNPKSKYSWEDINSALTAMNISPKRISSFVKYLK